MRLVILFRHYSSSLAYGKRMIIKYVYEHAMHIHTITRLVNAFPYDIELLLS